MLKIKNIEIKEIIKETENKKIKTNETKKKNNHK